MTSGPSGQGRPLSLLLWPALAMMIVASTGSIAQLADSSEYGLGAVAIYLVAALLFLVPVALVSAELATGWDGGVFAWVSAAYGDRWGFQAVWLQWIQSVALYPSLLSFAAASLAVAVGRPDLADDGRYVAVVVLVVFWAATWVAGRGLSSTARLSSLGLIAGTLVPALALIVLVVLWLARGEASAVPLQASGLVPRIDGFTSLALVVGTFVAFAGLEVNAVHVRDLAGRPASYLKALALGVVLVLAMYIPGSIAISVAVPTQDLDLDAGAAQAFRTFTDGLGVPGIGQLLSALLVAGAFAAAATWVAGPSRGLLEVGRSGYLPRVLQRTNGAGVQVPILLVQGGVVTALALAFVLLPSTSSAFAVLQAMTIGLYMLMYLLMFASALRLRRTRPDVVRGLRAPALGLLVTVGSLAALAAIALALTPPDQFTSVPVTVYVSGVALGVVLLATPPQLIYRYRRTGWATPSSG